MAEQKPNSGALFRNDKGDNPNRPDYKGSFTDSVGDEFWLSAWIKTDKNGNKYMSISAEEKNAKPNHTPKAKQSSPSNDEDDDLPF